jgi:protein-S-isoprenylcysteine O-methyltransferase Ste14
MAAEQTDTHALWNWKKHVLSWIWSPFLVAQIILVLFLGRYNEAGLDGVMWTGWAVWAVSVVFGFVPIFQFRRKGGVPGGKSYVHTTKMVVTGLYAVVRHPQYTAGILLSLALILISQNLLVLLLGVIMIPILYFDILMADRYELAKFGDDYRGYMEQVPRANFILGIIRLLKRRNAIIHYKNQNRNVS